MSSYENSSLKARRVKRTNASKKSLAFLAPKYSFVLFDRRDAMPCAARPRFAAYDNVHSLRECILNRETPIVLGLDRAIDAILLDAAR